MCWQNFPSPFAKLKGSISGGQIRGAAASKTLNLQSNLTGMYICMYVRVSLYISYYKQGEDSEFSALPCLLACLVLYACGFVKKVT